MQNADTNIAMLGIAMPAPGDVGWRPDDKG
jgi:hypothetical protein